MWILKRTPRSMLAFVKRKSYAMANIKSFFPSRDPISSKYGRNLLLSKTYQGNVLAIVIDEAHCIVDWGSDFRQDKRLGVLCALFPDIPVLAMTATASRIDIQCIQDSLGLKKCKSIIGNPDRKNIRLLMEKL
ncbi:Hypothetical predicted protein [Paramuricea clavata]|uniref:DNA 3'-5' helicase n=1 Tax=Paramuricea clavata TaxID=317549 RepID=A0A7D9E0Z5_PARCT|nr:Hypothetical predicted protein [Paramuricea clavata]